MNADEDLQRNCGKWFIGGLIVLILGLALIHHGMHGNTTYYAAAGSPGGGVEGTRDAKGPLVVFGGLIAFGGLVGTLAGISGFFRR